MHFFAVLAWCTILLEYKWLISTKDVTSRAKQIWTSRRLWCICQHSPHPSAPVVTQHIWRHTSHTIMLSGCTLVAVLHSGMQSSPGWRRTYRTPSPPKIDICVSLLHTTCFPCSGVQLTCSLAHSVVSGAEQHPGRASFGEFWLAGLWTPTFVERFCLTSLRRHLPVFC